MQPDPKDEAQEAEDHYEPAVLAEPVDVDEDARLKRIEEAESRESQREILLGQIAVARGQLYEAEAAGDAEKAAALEKKIAELTEKRKRL